MIKLKPLIKEDLSFLLEVRNDESTRKFLENDTVFTIEECNEWFTKTNPKWYIIFNEDNQKVGYIRTNGDEVGCDIHEDHRRKGYARLAYNEYLKDKDRASLWVFEDNFALSLYKSLGFKEDEKYKIIRDRKYIHMEYKKNSTCYIMSIHGIIIFYVSLHYILYNPTIIMFAQIQNS